MPRVQPEKKKQKQTNKKNPKKPVTTTKRQKTVGEAKPKVKKKCSNCWHVRWLQVPMKLFPLCGKSEGQFTCLLPSPLWHTHTDTHRHTHTHSISFSFYTPIMNGRLTSIIAFGDSLHFLGQAEYRGFRDNSAKNSHQNVQVFCLFYKWRNWSLWSLSFLKSHGEYFKPNSTYSSLFFLTMLYCLSMDRAGEHIGIKSVHSWQIVEKEG